MKTKMLDNARMFPWVAFVRIFLGGYWLYEVTIGHNWKTGSFTSGPHPGWFGPEAGSYLIEQGNAGIEAGTWNWFGWVLENIFYPNAVALSAFATAVQILLALAFIFGLFNRPMALLGLGMDLFIYFLGNSRIPPFFTIGHLFVLFTNAGLYYGVDGWLMNKYENVKTGSAKLIKSLITFDFITPKMRKVIASVCGILAFYYLLKANVIETGKITMVSTDLAVLFGFTAYGMFVFREGMSKIALTTSLLRIWLGYRLLHEIFVREVPAVNGLPGWGSGEQLAEVFQFIVEQHWGVFGSIVELAFLPFASFWAIAFAIIQTAVAVMFILGIRTRLASKLIAIMLTVLILIGFTRYAPFVLGYVVAVLTLNGGSMLSFDQYKNDEPIYGINISDKIVYALFAIALISVIAANIDGILPDGYKTSMGPVMGAMVAMLATMFGISGWLQNQQTVSNNKFAKLTYESEVNMQVAS
ncbi:hypothetical protein BKP45_15440 [Anaerobacillus alkalidiazotrophicus]|uniref:DoxX family protein n=1 Tax=Anaerobacillus alkalidiazotrophicus TaxID=472963 RepID=A0A1S2M5K4_9BACI|nr:hypothetical protein [Anaerobacillus alkalidiazotrophicus]OIJ18915.1 hypothetical protein BKP45_15440 [Anaerobacillus alkalidiazotrophicus]